MPILDTEVAIREAAFVLRARQRDEAAWVWLVEQHQTAVFRLAYLMLQDEAEARDVAQETFIRAYLKLEQFENGRSLRPWLLQIANRLAQNRQRSWRRYWEALRHWAEGETAVVSDHKDERLAAQRLWQAVRQLQSKAQTVLYLRYFLGLSVAETAVVLDIAVGTVKSRQNRALATLRQVIMADYPDLDPSAWKEGRVDA